MAAVMIRCPETGEAIPTGIGMPYEALKSVVMRDNTVVGCPACGGDHVWQGEDAFPDS